MPGLIIGMGVVIITLGVIFFAIGTFEINGKFQQPHFMYIGAFVAVGGIATVIGGSVHGRNKQEQRAVGLRNLIRDEVLASIRKEQQ